MNVKTEDRLFISAGLIVLVGGIYFTTILVRGTLKDDRARTELAHWCQYACGSHRVLACNQIPAPSGHQGEAICADDSDSGAKRITREEP